MITITYMQCDEELGINICDYLKKCCHINQCLLIQRVNAMWQELTLAFINMLKAIENRKTVARKSELEFYIRFFAERQLHHILNEYLMNIRCSSNIMLVILSHNEDAYPCIKDCLDNFLNHNIYCKLAPRPSTKDVLATYLEVIKHHINIGFNEDADEDKYQKLALGIIGCGEIFIKG
ncbi:MAG: hypothetical protein QW775_03350 [Ignisphaera sp.]|uniref:Uncharacterized protein n=1 Tax=Ignisphaera aggregans TaxID=334771 RepID=A0A7C4JKN3_9CREN